jgi:hypothetical protein
MAYQSAFLAAVFALLSTGAFAQQSASFALKRFEVLRVNSADIERMPVALRGIFADPVPDAELVDNLNEATKRVGFTPHVPKSGKMPRFAVISPIRLALKINVADLTKALHEAKADDVKVPQDWDGVTIDMQQSQGVYMDFGDFFIAESPPVQLSTRAGFQMDQFFEVLLRILGRNASEASALRQKFAASPANYFPIPPRYEMDIHDVKLKSGTGMLFQNASKQGELAFTWSGADHTYFLSGLIKESDAAALADSLQ